MKKLNKKSNIKQAAIGLAERGYQLIKPVQSFPRETAYLIASPTGEQMTMTVSEIIALVNQ